MSLVSLSINTDSLKAQTESPISKLTVIWGLNTSSFIFDTTSVTHVARTKAHKALEAHRKLLSGGPGSQSLQIL